MAGGNSGRGRTRLNHSGRKEGSAVELLKAFLTASQYTPEQLSWKVVTHLTFVISGVLFAVTDRIWEGRKGGSEAKGAGPTSDYC